MPTVEHVDLEFAPRYPCRKLGIVMCIYTPITLMGVDVGWGGQRQTDPFNSHTISPANEWAAGSVKTWSQKIKWRAHKEDTWSAWLASVHRCTCMPPNKTTWLVGLYFVWFCTASSPERDCPGLLCQLRVYPQMTCDLLLVTPHSLLVLLWVWGRSYKEQKYTRAGSCFFKRKFPEAPDVVI